VVIHIYRCEVKHDVHTGDSYLTQYQYTKKAIEKFFGSESTLCDTHQIKAMRSVKLQDIMNVMENNTGKLLRVYFDTLKELLIWD